MPPKEMHKIQMMYALYEDGMKEPIIIDEIKDLTLEEAVPILEEHNFVKVVRCKDCKHSKMADYIPAKCPYFCKLMANCHSGDFFCSMGERRDDD